MPISELSKYFNKEYDYWVDVGTRCSNEELKQRVTALKNEIAGYKKLLTKLNAMGRAFSYVLHERNEWGAYMDEVRAKKD